jgi:hypothetical protein
MKDWNKIKKEYVSIDEVPTARMTNNPWNEIFGEIPKGQALVLHEPEVKANTIWAALQRWQKKYGKFKNLRFSTKGKHGTATVYITNTTPSFVFLNSYESLKNTRKKKETS